MNGKSTTYLNRILEKVKPDQFKSFLNDNNKYMTASDKAFYYYMTDVIGTKGIKLKDIYSFAGVSESYGSKVLTMEKHTRNRDLIIRFCIAGHFSWDETNKALKLYGLNELYAKNTRDACIIVAINNRIYDLAKIDDLLLAGNMKKLSEDE